MELVGGRAEPCAAVHACCTLVSQSRSALTPPPPLPPPAPVARLMQALLRHQGVTRRMQSLCLAVWLFSPFTVSISTRGNGEALVTCMLLGMLACLQQGEGGARPV